MPRWLAEIIRNAALNSPGDQSEIRKGRRARPTPESGEAGQIKKSLELFDDAFAAVARNNERLAEAELYRLKGEMLLKVEDGRSRIEDRGSRVEDQGVFSSGHRDRPATRGEILGIAGRGEFGAIATATRQTVGSATVALISLRMVYRRPRHGGFEGRQSAT